MELDFEMDIQGDRAPRAEVLGLPALANMSRNEGRRCWS